MVCQSFKCPRLLRKRVRGAGSRQCSQVDRARGGDSVVEAAGRSHVFCLYSTNAWCSISRSLLWSAEEVVCNLASTYPGYLCALGKSCPAWPGQSLACAACRWYGPDPRRNRDMKWSPGRRYRPVPLGSAHPCLLQHIITPGFIQSCSWSRLCLTAPISLLQVSFPLSVIKSTRYLLPSRYHGRQSSRPLWQASEELNRAGTASR